MIDFNYFHLFPGIVILAMILIILKKQKRNLWYLFFFSGFWIYLLFAFSVIVFPIAPLSKNDGFRLSLNLIPFYFGTCEMPELCIRNIVDNILLTVPFGLGISFITSLHWKNFIWLAPLVGLVFEVLQLIIALLFRSPFRVVDINDVILNALGVWVGYILFRTFGFFYLFVTKRLPVRHISLFAYLHEVVRQTQ